MMLSRCALPVALVFTAVCAFAQRQEVAGARELFYAAADRRESLPPIRKAAASTPARPERKPAPPPAAGALHLGLRYNLVLVDSASGKAEPVSSDRNFRKGECFAIDFESNRSGYLYVLAKQSSGNWMPLFPSPQMVDESNVINPGQKMRVPNRYCFEIGDPPGTETLFVLLSRDPGEVYDLHEGIRRYDTPKPGPAKETMLIADARLVNNAVAQLSSPVYNRDLVVRKISQPADTREPAHSVYVVNASEKPASNVVAQIAVQHR